MKKTLIFSALMMGSMAAPAAMQQVDDAELSAIGGQFNLVSGINAGIFSDSGFSVASIAGSFGVVSLANLAAISGATLFNFGGFSGASGISRELPAWDCPASACSVNASSPWASNGPPIGSR